MGGLNLYAQNFCQNPFFFLGGLKYRNFTLVIVSILGNCSLVIQSFFKTTQLANKQREQLQHNTQKYAFLMNKMLNGTYPSSMKLQISPRNQQDNNSIKFTQQYKYTAKSNSPQKSKTAKSINYPLITSTPSTKIPHPLNILLKSWVSWGFFLV